MLSLGEKSLHSSNGFPICNYYDIDHAVLFELLAAKKDFVMIDMPELMLRMKVASMYTLDQLKDIFNDILNKIANAKPGDPRFPDVAALYYYPDIFQKPRDDYMAAMLYEIASDT